MVSKQKSPAGFEELDLPADSKTPTGFNESEYPTEADTIEQSRKTEFARLTGIVAEAEKELRRAQSRWDRACGALQYFLESKRFPSELRREKP